MKKNKHFNSLLQLNLAVLLISTSGALGRFIEMAPPLTIWMRSVIGAILLGLYCWHRKVEFRIYGRGNLIKIAISGVLLGIHWVTYFYSLQLSNVAIAMLSLFTYPIMTSFLEPLVLNTKFQPRHLVLGAMVLLGIYFLAPDFDMDNSYTQGIAFGLCSALSYSFRNLLLKNQVSKYSGSMLMLYQVVVITVLMLPVAFYFELPSNTSQWSAILALALITTAIGHTLLIMSFKNFSISTASIIATAQPTYGIIIGMIFLNEIPGTNTAIGGALIVSTVIIESLKSNE